MGRPGDRVRLIHWNADEAAERAERIRALGYAVDYEIPPASAFLRELGADPPAAVIIDLSRLPSQGRDFAILIRRRAALRLVPLVFVGGVPVKVARIRELLPDATYTSWEGLGQALAGAQAHPLVEPSVPESGFAAYAGKPLVEKLGIRPGQVIGLAHEPDDFALTLGQLPEGASQRGWAEGECDLSIWFVRSRAELDCDVGRMVLAAGRGPVWIAWPKKSSGVASDLTQQHVRAVGMARGLVDYKIASIDRTWSGLLFTCRETK